MNNELIVHLSSIMSFTYNLDFNDVKKTIECAVIQYTENIHCKEKKENVDTLSGLSKITKEKIDVIEQFDDGIIFCDDIFDVSNKHDNKVISEYVSVNATSTSCLIDNSTNIIDFFENKTISITQEQINNYADEMSVFMELYTPNYGIFDIDNDIIINGFNDIDIFSSRNGNYKKEDMKVLLNDIQEWMKTKNEDRYVVHVLSSIFNNNNNVFIFIDSYGDSFRIGGVVQGTIPNPKNFNWHQGIVNYLHYICRGHITSKKFNPLNYNLSKYKFTDNMIDIVKGFYSDKRMDFSYMVLYTDSTNQEYIYDSLHCKTLERMRNVAKREYENFMKYKSLYYKMNVLKAKEKRINEEKIEKDKEIYAELVKKYGENIEKKLL